MDIETTNFPEPKIGEECIFTFWANDIAHFSEGCRRIGILDKIECEVDSDGKLNKSYKMKNDKFDYDYKCCVPCDFVYEVNIDEKYPLDLIKVKKLIEDNLESLRL